MSKKFTRRIYSPKSFFRDISFMMKNMKNISSIKKNKEISKTFFEKIMTVVTAVNGCVYCKWFHAKKAVQSGVSAKEVKELFNLQFNADANNFEIPGLLFAQHYAETNRNPDEEMTENLINFYGKYTAEHIVLIIKLIFFGNLTGNTFDAFLARFKGQKAQNSNFFFEFFIFLISAPILVPAIPLVKKHR